MTGERSRRWQLVIIHEIAHQWFGNAVTESDWNDVWSEGFATYYTLRFRDHEYGHDDFVAGLKDSRNRVAAFYKDNYDFQIVTPCVEDLNNVSGPMMYQKGAWLRETGRLLHAVAVSGRSSTYRGLLERRRGHHKTRSDPDPAEVPLRPRCGCRA